jgi:flagellar P-ring protein precursor FlgI
VEREVDFNFSDSNKIRIALKTSDFSTAHRLEKIINSYLGRNVAKMIDSGTVNLDLGGISQFTNAEFLATIENLRIEPDATARVVVDQRSGTIVMSENVKISRIALSKDKLTVTVDEQPIVVQPNPFSEGESIILPRTKAEVNQEVQVALTELPTSVTLTDVVSGLNAIGISSIDLIDILKAMKAAGALHAELIVM